MLQGGSQSLDENGLFEQQPQPRVLVIDSRQLFGQSKEIRLRHRGEEYRLRITRQGKLILTK